MSGVEFLLSGWAEIGEGVLLSLFRVRFWV